MSTAETPPAIASTIRRSWTATARGNVYVVIDSAQELPLAKVLRDKHRAPLQTLFEGDAAEAMEEVAPLLAPIDPRSDFLDDWAIFWGNNPGVLLASAADLDTVHVHLRKIFVVEDETGQEFFFRFYDPRVIRTYLSTCTAAEVREFFGPILSWCVAGEEPEEVLVYTPGREGVTVTKLPLAAN